MLYGVLNMFKVCFVVVCGLKQLKEIHFLSIYIYDG